MDILFIVAFAVLGSTGTVALSQAPEESAGYLEGDIVGISPYFFQGKSGLRDEKYRWKNGTIPYQFEENYPLESQMRFQEAIAHISSLTCLKFVPYTTEEDYLRVISDSGCYAAVGRMGGEQVVSLPEECTWFGIGTIVHEIIHVSGFFHEQSRTDRDNFIVVNYENIISGKEHNFNKYDETKVSSFDIGYDYDSIMHYPERAFSSNGKATITTNPPGIHIGQRKGMSPKDVLKVNKMYMCNDK